MLPQVPKDRHVPWLAAAVCRSFRFNPRPHHTLTTSSPHPRHALTTPSPQPWPPQVSSNQTNHVRLSVGVGADGSVRYPTPGYVIVAGGRTGGQCDKGRARTLQVGGATTAATSAAATAAATALASAATATAAASSANSRKKSQQKQR